ncbi:LacI family transcriptional regulator [Candidatus Acetothermia bacterium]|nr:MAG: LacI family transcriptional regulator [Candidatus Acetothermia bacterium]
MTAEEKYAILESVFKERPVAGKRVTIKMIAQEAGVSPATVSRVVNNKRNVRPELAERVREAIRKLDYHANEVARGLVRGTVDTFGVVVPDISNTFFSRICKAIQNTVMPTGAAVFLHNTDGILNRERQIIKELASKLITGIFLVAPRMPATEIRTLADELGVYPVVVDARVENCRLAAVWVDNVTAFIEASEHLISKGHKRIGFIAGPLAVANSKDRLDGYRIALRNHGIKEDTSLIYESDFTIAGGYKTAKEMFRKRNPPTAVLCSNDLMAVGVLSYLHKQGVEVPSEISVVGCDDIDVASSLSPPLTTVSQPIYELGVTAAQMMLQYTSTNEVPPNSILHAKLIIRNSTSNVQEGKSESETHPAEQLSHNVQKRDNR